MIRPSLIVAWAFLHPASLLRNVESFVVPCGSQQIQLSSPLPKATTRRLRFRTLTLTDIEFFATSKSSKTPHASSLESSEYESSLPIKRQQRKFQYLSWLYGGLAVLLFVMPDRTLSRKLATKMGGAAGYGVAAAVAQLLASTGGLQVDDPTRKRLTIGLCGFSALGLWAIPGEAGFLKTAGSAMILTLLMNAAKVWGFLVAWSGLQLTLSSSEATNATARTRELKSSLMKELKGLRVQKEAKKRSLFYRNCLLLVLTGMVSSLLEGIFYVRYLGSSLGRSFFDISLQWSAVARLFLISSVIVSLKDLADRKQMTVGTSFIQMNLMVSAWAALVGVGQRLSLTGFHGRTNQRVEMLALALLFLVKGVKYAKFRSDEQKGIRNPLLKPPPQFPNDDVDDDGGGDRCR